MKTKVFLFILTNMQPLIYRLLAPVLPTAHLSLVLGLCPWEGLSFIANIVSNLLFWVILTLIYIALYEVAGEPKAARILVLIFLTIGLGIANCVIILKYAIRDDGKLEYVILPMIFAVLFALFIVALGGISVCRILMDCYNSCKENTDEQTGCNLLCKPVIVIE